MNGDEERFRQRGWPGVRSKLFHIWFLLRRPMTLGARGIVFDRAANSVFLIEHTYVPGWQLPGGGVETGETFGLALERELREEGNIELTGQPKLVSLHHNRQSSRRDHVAVYLIEDFRQSAPKAPDIEIKASGYFPLDALPENTTPATRRRLAEVFDGAETSPWW